MNELIGLRDAVPVLMSTREIATLTGKRHADVLRDVRVLTDQLRQNADLRFVCKPTNYAGRNGQQYLQYELDNDTCLTLLLGYDPVAHMKVVKRWRDLEAQDATPAATLDPANLTRIQSLQIAMDSENGRLAVLEERDEAIRTKAQIGSRREATAMATASAARREVQRLIRELGRNRTHATIIAVENAMHCKFGSQAWRPLRNYRREHCLETSKVQDPRWGSITAWSAAV